MLSIAVTSYNRSDLTIESFSKVYDHPLVSQIVIVDDHSDPGINDRLEELIDNHPASEKIFFYVNPSNLGMSRNKAEAVSKAKNKRVVLLDSDNVLEPEYLDAAFGDMEGLRHIEMFPTTIYCPDFAKPDFDFTAYADHVIDSGNAKNYLNEKNFRVFLNTCNYIVDRDKYLEVYKYDESIQESDTIHFNYLWLSAGYSFYIVPGMRYFHRKHEGSGWLRGDHAYNLKKAAELQEKIKNL